MEYKPVVQSLSSSYLTAPVKYNKILRGYSITNIVQHAVLRLPLPFTPHVTLLCQVVRLFCLFRVWQVYSRHTVDVLLSKPQSQKRRSCSVNLCTSRCQSCHPSLRPWTAFTCHLYPPGLHPILCSLHQQAWGKALIRFLISAAGFYLRRHNHCKDIFR